MTQNIPLKMHVNFRFRPSKGSSRGTLYCRITVEGTRAPEKSTSITIFKNEWDEKRQTAKPSAATSTSTNARLNSIRSAIDMALLEMGPGATAIKLADQVFAQTRKEPMRLSDAHALYAELKRSTTENSPRTYKKYGYYLANINKYFQEKDPYMADISEQVYLRFCIWLKEQFDSRDYVAKNAQYLRTLLTLAASRGHIAGNPSELIMLKKDDKYDTTHLSFEQVRKIFEHDFSGIPVKASSLKVITEERDAFVFCCFTGMHHVDYSGKDYELYANNGRTWLRGYRVKSIEGIRDKLYEMPLHPMAEAIIHRYGGIDKLPIRNNAERNIRLKTIAAYCGIAINLSTKIARKTMANYCLNTLRMRQETVAAVLGLKSTKYLKHYARITQESIDAEMVFPSPSCSVPLPVMIAGTTAQTFRLT